MRPGDASPDCERRSRIDSRTPLLNRIAVPLWALLLAGVLLWPITRGGYLLGRDMVFTPAQPLNLGAIGVSSTPPRAVPVDALVAIAERLADGAVVGRVAVGLPVLAAGIGAALLLRSRSLTASLAACGVAIWNPFVVERLGLGQWALVWAYAALPWLVLAATSDRRAARRLGVAGAVAAASITPTGGVIAAVTAVALAVGIRRRRREVLETAGIALALQLPWLVPALVSTAAATSDPAGVAAFSARAEHPGGALLSLLDGGGIWNADVVPDSRAGAWPWVWLAVLALAALYGTGRLVELLGRRVVVTLAGLAGAGLLVAVLPSVPGGAAIVRAMVEHVPGAGLLRDAQKWVLPLVLLEALLVGAAVLRLVERLPAAPLRGVAVAAAVALPVIVLPDAAATLRPTFEPVHYPADWRVVAHRVGSATVAVLPWGSYRAFDWAPDRVVLDPAPRWFRGHTLVDDRLAVDGRLLRGEDPQATDVAAALNSGPKLPTRLAALGVAWVVVEHGTPGELPALTGLGAAYRGRDLSLYRVPGPIARQRPAAARVAAVVAADVLAMVTLLALLGATLRVRRRRSKSRRKTRSGA